MKMRKIAAVVASVAVAAALAVSASAETAGLIFKTSNWAHRNNVSQKEAMYENEDLDTLAVPGFKAGDVTVDKDGQYTATVEWTAMDDGKDGEDTFFYYLGLDTNISADTYPDLKITIDSLKIDGKEIEAGKNATMESGNPEASGSDSADFDKSINRYCVCFFNEWASDKSLNVISSKDDFGRKIEVTFTVSGMTASSEGVTTEAPGTDAAGDTNKPTDDKNNAETGVEGVAVVAGIAVLAVGAVIVAKKRK